MKYQKEIQQVLIQYKNELLHLPFFYKLEQNTINKGQWIFFAKQRYKASQYFEKLLSHIVSLSKQKAEIKTLIVKLNKTQSKLDYVISFNGDLTADAYEQILKDF